MLINRTNVKKFALNEAQRIRGGKFTRVSAEFIEAVEFSVRQHIRKAVESHPSIGVTLK